MLCADLLIKSSLDICNQDLLRNIMESDIMVECSVLEMRNPSRTVACFYSPPLPAPLEEDMLLTAVAQVSHNYYH